MKLHEFEAKKIFSDHGIPVPRGVLITDPQEASKAFETIGGPVVLKSQILVAGRGKAGGIVKADSAGEATEVAKRLLGSKIKGSVVAFLLIEERLDVKRELYLGLTIDRSARRPVLIASAEGGVDLEELARERPEAVVKRHLDPTIGLKNYQARSVAKAAGLKKEIASQYASIARSLFTVFTRFDCELAESNPLALTGDSRLVSLDARVIVDDSAAFRHPELEREREELTPLEAEASKKGFSFVELDGDVGVIGNGAGLVMSTLDMVSHYGGRPANFLDVGGGARADLVDAAVKMVLTHPRVKVVLLNILGGITRCDEVARGLVKALEETRSSTPLVVRLVGTREEEGQKILSEAGIRFLNSMEEAAQVAVNLAKGG